MGKGIRRGLASLAGALVAGITLGLPAQAAALPVTYNWLIGFAAHIGSAQKAPAGAITYDAGGRLAACSSPGKLPVILVHGTWENQNDNWQAGAPLLANSGRCVYTFNYGANRNDVFDGTKSIAAAAGELGTFVDAVRAATGSNQVDVLGHSQGGMMPRYYIKFGRSFTGGSFGAGTSKIHSLVGLAPSNHGTTLSGITQLGRAIGLNPLTLPLPQAAIDQQTGSDFNRTLDTCPGGLPSADICAGDPVNYTVIETNGDQVVTPYTNAFLTPNPQASGTLTNVLVQNGCPRDFSEHLALAYDSYAYGLVLRALGADPRSVPGASPSCKLITPYVGG